MRFDMSRLVEELFHHLGERGYKSCIVSLSRLHDLQDEVEERLRRRFLDKEFYQERLAWFRFQVPEELSNAQSIIAIAAPRPQSQATFTWNGVTRPLIVPPTYTAYDETRKKVEDLIAEILGQEGYKLARTALPLKLLSVRSGLSEYGRNNICYVTGMGSFLQLVAVYSDMPCEKDQWQEAEMMKSCQNCQLCRQACPTGAIPSDRFLLRAEKCISYHNERKGDIAFPDWMKPSWHNCVVGCLHCQRACPENRDFLKWIEEKEQFTEEETALLLEGVTSDQLPKATVEKLERLNLIDYLENLPRNLGAFFKKKAH